MPDAVKQRYTAADGVRHGRHDRARRRAAAGDPHRRRRPHRALAQAAALPAGRARRARASARRPARRSARSSSEGLAMRKNQDLTLSQMAMAANAPMLIKATMVDGKPEVGVLPTGQVTGVIGELPTVAELLDRIVAEAEATLEAPPATAADGPDLVGRRGGLPGRGPSLADHEPGRVAGGPRRRAALGRHRARASPSTSSGSAGSSPTGWAVVSWPPEPRRPRAPRCGSGSSSRRSTTGPAARPASPRTASSCWPRASSSSARRSSRTRILPRMAGGRGPVVPGLVRAERRQRPGQRHQPGPARRRRLGAQRPEDLDHPRRVLHPPVRAVPHRPRQRAPQGPHLPARAARHRRASPCAASAGSTATRASPRCSSTTPSCADDAVARRRGARRAEGGLVGGHGHHRLRARPHAALARPLHRDRRAARRPCAATSRATPCCSDRAATAWMHAEAYQLQTLADRHQAGRRGAKAGAESSLTKLWWSELDVELHEIALDLLGPDAELDGPWSKGWQFSLSGPDLRRHQRDPAQHRRRAPPGPPATMRFALTRRPARLPGRGARPAGQGVPARPCVPRPHGTPPAGRARPRRRGTALDDDGRARHARARGPTAASASTRRGSCPSSRRPAAPPCPTRSSRRRWWRAPLAAGVEADRHASPSDARRPARRRARPTPTASCCSSVDGSLADPVAATRSAIDRAVDDRRRRPPSGSDRAAERRGSTTRVTDDPAARRARPRPRRARARPPSSSASASRCSTSPSATSIERQQFGVPIGQLPGGEAPPGRRRPRPRVRRPAVLPGGLVAGHDAPTRARDVSMAKAMASDAAELVGRKALQCHGAIGYTVEYDLHLYLKRTWAAGPHLGRQRPPHRPSRRPLLRRRDHPVAGARHARGLHRRRRPHPRRAGGAAA